MKHQRNMNKEELIELGRKSFTPTGHCCDEYRKIFNIKDHSDYGTRWAHFLEGWTTSLELIQDQQRKDYKVDEFIDELTILCKKYNASICAGDYESGAQINDYHFGLNI